MRFEEYLADREYEKNELSDEQMRAIESDGATVVSAGAGSGKTFVLSLRFVRLVLEQDDESGRGAHCDEILTLTFTNKAANEMHERIYKKLCNALSDDRKRKEEEIDRRFPKAAISTMDSFWSEIARADCLKYGVSRDFSVVDDLTLRRIVVQIVNSISSDKSVSEGWIRLSENYQRGDMIDRLVTIAEDETDILTEFSAEENIESYDLIASMIADEDELMEDFIFAWEELRSIIKTFATPNTKEKLLFSMNEAFECFENRDYAGIGNKPDLRSTRSREIKDFTNNHFRKISEKLKQAKSLKENRKYTEDVSLFLEDFIKRVNEEKRKRSLLTYRDVSSLAEAVLTNNRTVRNWYKKKYKYIMIDEFQDNNRKQMDMLKLLAERNDAEFAPRIPEDRDVDWDKLFFVGDEKQSIYAFRGADVSVFKSLKKTMEENNGTVLSLSTNYRSEPALINHFNTVFETIFSPEPENEEDKDFTLITGSAPVSAYEASYSVIGSREGTPGINSRAEMYILPEASDEEEIDKNVKSELAEAWFIAKKIEEMVTGVGGYEVADESTGGVRTPKYSDIAILLRKTRSQFDIEKALRTRGIRYTVGKSASSMTEGVASDIYCFLQLLLYPYDMKAYISLLRSPFARISDEALLLFVDREENIDESDDDEESEEGHGDNGIKAFETDLNLSGRDKKAYESLKEIYDESLGMVGTAPITEILTKIWYESGYWAWVSSSEGISAFEDHFKYLWGVAESYDKAGESLSTFLDFIRPHVSANEDEYNSNRREVPEVPIQHLSSDAVRIMTIHSAKGLEFPIVFIPSMEKKRGTGLSEVCSVSGEYPYLMIPKIKTDRNDSDPIKDVISGGRKIREDAEGKRLLYVGFTRAEDYLILSACEKSKENRDSFLSMYRCSDAVEEEYIPMPSEDEMRPLNSVKPVSSVSPDAVLYEKGKQGRKRQTVKKEIQVQSKGEWLESLSIDGMGDPEMFGTAVHEAIEAKLNERKPMFASISDKEAEVASRIADEFTESEFFRKYVRPYKYETEVRFYYPENGVSYEGVADLVVFTGQSILIADYKTDKRRNPEQHRDQLEMYAKALSGIYKKKCSAVVLYVRGFVYDFIVP